MRHQQTGSNQATGRDWQSRICREYAKTAFAGLALLALVGCTVEPLNSSTAALSANVSDSTRVVLERTSVSPVSTRVAQQVRNALLFAMNGGTQKPGGRYRVDLSVVSTVSNLSVQVSSLAPTSAQVKVAARYNVVEIATAKSVASGQHTAIAGFDKTPQSFANERAERDAQNRAAREAAQRIHLSVASAVAGP
ncbi:MAG: LPS assembly lipoprotein LptE [Pseudomonadota bacterium]